MPRSGFRPELAPRASARWHEGSRSRWSGTTARPDLHVVTTSKVGGAARQRLVSRCWRLEHTLLGVAVARGWSFAARRDDRTPTGSSRGRRRSAALPVTGGSAGAGASSKRTLAGDAVTRGWSSAMTRDDRSPRPARRYDSEGRRRMPSNGFRPGLAPRACARWQAMLLHEGSRPRRSGTNAERTMKVGGACPAAAFGRSWPLEQAHAGTRVVVRAGAERPLAPTCTS